MPTSPSPTTRTATDADLPVLFGFDHVAADDPARSRLITESVATGTCIVATDAEDRPIGYLIFQHRFFGHALIELVYTDAAHRRRGVATALISHCERRVCQTPKLFASTNQSNGPMRNLLAKLGFTQTGTIDALDEGDPELIHVKRLTPLRTGQERR
jgi:ribosomal protein S18 acetylase RimI-like enzyme